MPQPKRTLMVSDTTEDDLEAIILSPPGPARPKTLKEPAPGPEPKWTQPTPHKKKFTTTPVNETTLPALQQKIIDTKDIEANTDLRMSKTPRVDHDAYQSQFYETTDEGILRRAEVGSELRGLFHDRPGRRVAESELDRFDPFPHDGPARPKWDQVPDYKPENTHVYDRLQ